MDLIIGGENTDGTQLNILSPETQKFRGRRWGFEVSRRI